VTGGLLDGRTAVVTGGANGIGAAIVAAFAQEGARVTVIDREQLIAAPAGTTLVEFDLADTAGIDAVVESIESSFGPVDVLVNNAAIFEPALAVDLTLESYRRVIAVNLDAPIFLSSRFGARMAARGYGRIVSVSSVHGTIGEPTALSYDAAKGALNQATRTLALELAHRGVLVNAVAPGYVRTRLSVVDGVNELDTDRFRTLYLESGRLPIGRAAEPPEIAEHAAWLCSSRNTYVTGQVLYVDGGLSVTL
jgi:NAD(P)-dependent dehydrogenase (short-subunit alcohol dehydrogenase family)